MCISTGDNAHAYYLQLTSTVTFTSKNTGMHLILLFNFNTLYIFLALCHAPQSVRALYINVMFRQSFSCEFLDCNVHL